MNYLTQEKIFHFFVFTKAKYAESFERLHFNLLAKTDQVAFLENGTPDIQDYLHDLPRVEDQANKKIAAIVMNANPFTLGHQYLVEKAAAENDWVHLFMVSEDKSLVPFSVRQNDIP